MLLKLNRSHFVFLIPVLVFVSVVILCFTPLFLSHTNALSNAVILDLVLTVPVIYFWIVKNRDIPKITVISVFIIGLITASFIIPEENQKLLTNIKYWILPIAEILVMIYVIVSARKVISNYKIQSGSELDFYSALKRACKEVLPLRIANLLAFEITVVYYAFFVWFKNDIKEDEFTYYKRSSIRTVIGAFIFLALIETFAVHLVVGQWSEKTAWVLSFISIYTCIQLVALIKSLPYRLIKVDIENSKLLLRYGFFSETTIDLKNIKSIEKSKRSLPDDKSIIQFSPLGILDTHNIFLHLDSKQNLYRIYGIRKSFLSLAIFMDNPDEFIATIKKATLPVQ